MDLQFSSFLIILLIITFVLMVRTKSKTLASASKLPPGPWKLPLIGNLHQLLLGSSLVHHTLRDLANKHGSLMYLRLGQIPTLVVSSAESAKQVMKTHDTIFASRPETLFSKVVLYDSKDIIFGRYGEYWRQLRKIVVQEVLSSARVESFRAIREEAMSDLVAWIASREGSVINLTEKIVSSTYGITAKAAFGSQESEDRAEFISAIEECVKLSAGFAISDFFPSLASFPLLIGPFKSRLERVHRKIDRILENIVGEHKKKRLDLATTCQVEEEEEDLIDVLLKFHNSTNDQGFSLSNDNIKAVLMDVFSAGSETSATAADWAMAEMIKNPQVMQKAQEEVRNVFRRNGSTSETGISEMTYLKCVVKETLRLHPSAPLLLPRESQDICEIDSYKIPEKTRVIVNAWAIGRDRRYWANPESFIPERFLDSSIDFKGNNFEYIPFGAGRRICPGMAFGLINIEFPLAMLLYHFDWKLPNGKEPQDLDMTESFGITVRRIDYLHLVPRAICC